MKRSGLPLTQQARRRLSAIGTFALDANCEGGTLSLLTQDSAKTKRRVDTVSGYRHPCRIRPITRARRVFRVSANNREVVFSNHLCCERRERFDAQHPGRQSSFFTVSLYPATESPLYSIAALRGSPSRFPHAVGWAMRVPDLHRLTASTEIIGCALRPASDRGGRC